MAASPCWWHGCTVGTRYVWWCVLTPSADSQLTDKVCCLLQGYGGEKWINKTLKMWHVCLPCYPLRRSYIRDQNQPPNAEDWSPAKKQGNTDPCWTKVIIALRSVTGVKNVQVVRNVDKNHKYIVCFCVFISWSRLEVSESWDFKRSNKYPMNKNGQWVCSSSSPVQITWVITDKEANKSMKNPTIKMWPC